MFSILFQYVLVKHAPWFVMEYGSLSVWSCQGLENSHHAAKNAYHKHTQHGGSKHRISPLIQTYQHWYRIIQHRFHNKDNIPVMFAEDLPSDIILQRRREASLNSSASAHHAIWRSKCIRKGRKWVPTTEGEAEVSISEVHEATLIVEDEVTISEVLEPTPVVEEGVVLVNEGVVEDQ